LEFLLEVDTGGAVVTRLFTHAQHTLLGEAFRALSDVPAPAGERRETAQKSD
jgi:hypothetical protein